MDLLNPKTVKIFKGFAITSSILAVIALLMVSLMLYLLYQFAPEILFS